MLDLQQRYPDVTIVDTSNFSNNAPMLAINVRMGFQLHAEFVFYKIRVVDLAAFLRRGE